MENVSGDTHFINGKRLHGVLHAVEGCGLPDVIGREVVSTLGWHRLVVTLGAQFDRDFVGLVVGNFDDVSNAFPVGSKFASVAQAHLVPHGEFYISKLQLWQNKARKMLGV
ncbi:hypothetical protein BKA80DRAFT_284105 [Phyllosticta citrichinensis]